MHSHAAQMPDFGTIVTFDIRGGLAAGTRFAEALELFALTSSLGSTDSLVSPRRCSSRAA